MTTNNRESIRPRLVGYTYEGGFDMDCGFRHHKHGSTGRRNWRRKYGKRQRQRWDRDFPVEDSE